MRGGLSLPTTGPRLVDLLKLIGPQDAGKLMQLLSQAPRPQQSIQGQRYAEKPQWATNPFKELRGRM